MELRKGGAMTNPYDFRDLMKAVYGYSDETPEAVIARMDGRAKGKKGAKGARPGKVRPDQLAKMKAINAAGKERAAAAKSAAKTPSG